MTTTDDGARTGASAPAVRQALMILEALSDSDCGLTLTEVSEALSLPKNAVFRICQTLLSTGYLDRETESLRFCLTNKFLGLGRPKGSKKTLGERAAPALRQLRDECRETVQLGVWSGDGGVIIEVVDGLFPLRIAVEAGLRFPLHNNAPGKCLLAHLSTEARSELIGRLPLPASTSRTITDPAMLLGECERVVDQGYATDHAEADEGIHCIAAPVFDRHNQSFATVWVSGPSKRMPKESFSATGSRVRRAADRITAALER